MREAADALGITEKAVRHRIERGKLQSLRRNGRVLIPEGALGDDYQPEPFADVPDRELLQMLLEARQEAGRQEGMKLIAEQAQSTETELREALVQVKTEAAGLTTRKTELEQAVEQMQTELKALEDAIKQLPARHQKRIASNRKTPS